MAMADESKGIVAAGASLVWRHQRVFWWVFAVNLALAALGTASAHHQLEEVLGQSLASRPLTNGFDFGMFIELFRVPESNLYRSHHDSFHSGALFFLFMLFVAGGILTVYHEDRRLKAAEYFGACGTYFWRFVRLMLLSLIPFATLAGLYNALDKLSTYVDDRVTPASAGFSILAGGCFLLVLGCLWVRLWFDIAQVRAVAQNEQRMLRNLWKAFGITWRNLGQLFWIYFLISLLAWVSLVIGLVIWAHLPPTTTPIVFVLLEMIVAAQLATRLWQRASAITWYGRHAAMFPSDAADCTTPAPVELVEPETGSPASAPLQELEAGPEPENPEGSQQQP
jgi:hypothetical protein